MRMLCPSSARLVHLEPVEVVLGHAQRELGGAQNLRLAVAAQAFVGRVHVDDAELGVAQHQRRRRGVEDRAVLLLAAAQALVRGLARGDVAADVEHMRAPWCIIGTPRTSTSAILPSGAFAGAFELDRLAGERALVQREQARAQLRQG
jgi:hypothetical protein